MSTLMIQIFGKASTYDNCFKPKNVEGETLVNCVEPGVGNANIFAKHTKPWCVTDKPKAYCVEPEGEKAQSYANTKVRNIVSTQIQPTAQFNRI